MQTERLDDLLDRLVAEYSERLAARPADKGEDFVRRVPEEHRAALERCFKLMRAGFAAAPGARRALGPGVEIAGYRIERELGRGGMAVVYLATQLDLKRPVAFKVLRAGLAIERRHVDRFQREALAAARLQHPHIVQVYAVGEADGLHWLAMEYVDGLTLAEIFAKLPPAPQRRAEDLARAIGLKRDHFGSQSFEQALCALLVPVARALAVTHDLGIVHRDIKPSNILVTREGRAQLADFGLAKGDGDPGLSLTGEPLGTPYYMSPEQAAMTANRVDQRSDVYSFGVTLYEGIGGRCPFVGDSVMAVLEALRSRSAPPLRTLNRNVSRDADAVVRRAMAREPGDRYFSAMELASDCQIVAAGGVTQAAAAEGGPLRRFLREARAGFCANSDGYRSELEFLGWPLLHINGGLSSSRKRRIAKGWIAIGDVAVGGFAMGGMAFGGVAFGGLSVGLVSFAGLAIGALALGGVALGGLCFGGFAAGFAAIGGGGAGYYVLAAKAWALHAVTHTRKDPEALAFFRALEPWMGWLPSADVYVEMLRRD